MKWYNVLGIPIIIVGVIDWLVYTIVLIPLIDIVIIFIGIYLVFYKPKERKMIKKK